MWIYGVFTECCTALHQKILRQHRLNSADTGQLLKNFLRMKQCPELKNFWCWALVTLYKRTCGQMMKEEQFRDAAVTSSLLRHSWLLCSSPCSGLGAGIRQILHCGWRSSGGGWSILLSLLVAVQPYPYHWFRLKAVRFEETPCHGDLARVGELAKGLPAVSLLSWGELTFGQGDTKQTSRSGSKAQGSQQRFFPHLRTWPLKYLCTC